MVAMKNFNEIQHKCIASGWLHNTSADG